MQLGRLGVWGLLDALPAPEVVRLAGDVERWGYTALWMGEAMGRDVLASSAWLLASTQSLIIAPGIANIYARDAMAMAAVRAQLNEQSGGRFLLGMGVSHAPLVSQLRGHDYGKPVAAMKHYLEAMSRARYVAPAPKERPRTVLAALGPQMLAVARDLADGAHPYNVTVAQTAAARSILGAGKLLCVEQKVLLENDPKKARQIARATLKPYLGLPNYLNSWRRAGFTDADFADDLSDRLVDALIAWGDEAAAMQRIREHWEAGADHVCIQALAADPRRSVLDGPDRSTLERLAAFARDVNCP